MANSNDKISMKLLIDSKNNKVLFAEAGKECVDFFLHLLALPIGTVVRCLTKEAMVGSLGNLYGSLDNLSNDYLVANLSKDCLLNPKVAIGSSPGVPLLMINEAPNTYAKKYYMCNRSGCYYYVSDGEGASCTSCNSRMTRTATYVRPPAAAETSQGESGGAGYVKGVVTYMIMDDLALSPMSSISSITLLNKFNVKDVGCLQEKVVSLDMYKGIALLKASLISKAVLTDVFLGKTRI